MRFLRLKRARNLLEAVSPSLVVRADLRLEVLACESNRGLLRRSPGGPPAAAAVEDWDPPVSSRLEANSGFDLPSGAEPPCVCMNEGFHWPLPACLKNFIWTFHSPESHLPSKSTADKLPTHISQH